MDYRTVYEGGTGEIVEKKSRFIARVFPVEREEEADRHLADVKKQYWDARHHCWAYIIGGEQVQERFSDDGEPAGTAGKPILEVLRGHGLHNVLIVVIRYFGGTLLGTGGLVRAYTQSAQAGLAASTMIMKIEGYKVKIKTDYSTLGKLQYLLAQRTLPVIASDYTDSVTLTTLIPAGEEDNLLSALTESTNGQAEITRDCACRFAYNNGEPIIF